MHKVPIVDGIMAENDKIIEEVTTSDYKYGFVTQY